MSSDRIIQAFARLEQAYADMEAFLEREHEHLMGPDWQALADDQRRRQTLTQELADADRQRQELGKALGLTPEAPWGELLPGGPSAWAERRQALKDRIERVQEANEANTRLIREAFERNERLIHWLTGAGGESAYNAYGQERTPEGAGLLSRRA